MDKNKIKRYKLLGEKIKKLEEERKNLRCELAKICTHPAEFVTKYKWHHGYGKYVEGLQCTLCQARQSFADTGAWISFDVYSKAERGYSWEG